MSSDPDGPAGAYRQAPVPPEGGWRVHPDPAALPRLRHEGPGGNRYDDPNGQYTVRYLAERLTGSPSPLGTSTTPTHLDEGVIRISGPIGRPITRALSRAVYEWLPDAAGLAYRSRLDDAELCWALWDHNPVDIPAVDALTPAQPAHLHAVRAVAALLQIDLINPWA